MVCGQDPIQKSLPPLTFNQLYSPLCLPTPQRATAFDMQSQQSLMPSTLPPPPPQLPQSQGDFSTPPTTQPSKSRSQNGLMQLLGAGARKRPSTGSKSSEEKRQLTAEESAIDNAASRSSYMCRKCRAHGRLIAVRQHKRNCPYKHCNCSVCSLVNYGRHIVARQIALYRDQKNHSTEEGGGLGGAIGVVSNGKAKGHGGSRSREKVDVEDEGPHCRRCRNHGKTNPWKGHKKICPFYYCICQQCILITLRKSNEKNLRRLACLLKLW